MNTSQKKNTVILTLTREIAIYSLLYISVIFTIIIISYVLVAVINFVL